MTAQDYNILMHHVRELNLFTEEVSKELDKIQKAIETIYDRPGRPDSLNYDIFGSTD